MRPHIAFFLLLLTGVTALHAQSTAADLSSHLVHQPFFLRGLWQGDKLQFDGTGILSGSSDKTSPMLSAIDIDKVELKPDHLLLSGHRDAIAYVDHQPRRRKLDKLKIEIAASPAGDYSAALASIFTKDLADLAPAAPDYWQPFLLHGSDITFFATKTAPTSADRVDRKIGGAVKPPTPLNMPEPAFNREAKKIRLSGNSLIYLHTEKDGAVTHVRILRPLGAGLDEAAVHAVQSYKFAPANENGNPVAVELNVEVNFQIY